VRADRQAIPLHLGDDRFMHSKDVETEIGPIAGMPDVVLEGGPSAVVRGIVRAPSVRARFDALGDVRARTEILARPLQHHAMNGSQIVGLAQRVIEFSKTAR